MNDTAIPSLGPVTQTQRGFEVLSFSDRYGARCSLQASSLAENEKPGTSSIWLGTDAADPQVMAIHASSVGVFTTETTGWVPYPIPPEVLLNTRMHLDRAQVAALVVHLQNWLTHDRFEPQLDSNKTDGLAPTHLEVAAHVRYWEDATVNGVEDTQGTLIPFRKGDAWCPVIRLADGLVQNWPVGTSADVHYKVCDAGEYWLQNAAGQRVAKWGGFYVPDDFLAPGEQGFGDYVILKVGADGFIQNWKKPAVDMDGDSEQQTWKTL